MPSKRKTLALLLAVIASPTGVSGQGPDPAMLDSLIVNAVADHHLIGVSVGVMVDGQVILAKGYGARSVDCGEPVTPETMFRIGSVSKQFTCAATLVLAEGKRFSADSWKALMTPLRLRDGRSSGYSCGLGVGDRGAALVLSHGGAVSCLLYRRPDGTIEEFLPYWS